MRITPEVYSKLQHFVPIKSTKGQSKDFRLIKNGVSTGVFQEIPEYIENVLDEEEILSLENQNVINNNNNNNSNLIGQNDNIENRIEEQNDGGESDGRTHVEIHNGNDQNENGLDGNQINVDEDQ